MEYAVDVNGGNQVVGRRGHRVIRLHDIKEVVVYVSRVTSRCVDIEHFNLKDIYEET